MTTLSTDVPSPFNVFGKRAANEWEAAQTQTRRRGQLMSSQQLITARVTSLDLRPEEGGGCCLWCCCLWCCCLCCCLVGSLVGEGVGAEGKGVTGLLVGLFGSAMAGEVAEVVG
jgi:hypothetical protein